LRKLLPGRVNADRQRGASCQTWRHHDQAQTSRLTRPRSLALALAGVLTTLLVFGCTSDDPNVTGIGLLETSIDSVLISLEIPDVLTFGNLSRDESDQPFAEREVLYFGQQDSEQSALLVRYEFSGLPSEQYPDSLFSELYIQKIDLLLYMLEYYIDFTDPSDPDSLRLQKTYQVHELADTLDVSLYPGPEPAYNPVFVNLNPTELEPVGEIILPMSIPTYLQWYENGGHTGLIVRQGETGQEVDGFVGFTSVDFDTLAHASQLPLLASGTLPFPVLRVTFNQELELVPLRMLPIADVSTFSELDPIPQDFANGIALRTHQINYPYLRFNLDAIPPNVLINRAVVHVVNDTSLSYGPTESLVLSQVTEEFAPGGDISASRNEFAAASEAITGRINLDPYGGIEGADIVLEFNCTNTLQSHQNGSPYTPLTFMISAAEDFHTPSFNTTPTGPDFYLIRFNFFGTADADPAHRPALKVIYTRENAVTGGEE